MFFTKAKPFQSCTCPKISRFGPGRTTCSHVSAQSKFSRRTILATPLVSSFVAGPVMAGSQGALKRAEFNDSQQEYVILNNGLKLPLLGLGTSSLKGEACENAVKSALQAGYKHIDTAGMYGNEDAVGRGIKVVDRKDVFLTSKLRNEDHGRVEEAVKEQLETLQTDYIDLYLIHWPVPRINPEIKVTWRALEKLYEQGKFRAIGVSNFSVVKLKDVQSYAKIQPAVNQVEVHVWHRNQAIVDYSLQSGVQIQAYTPMGATPVWTKENKPANSDPTVIEMAQKYNKTPNQVLLRWNLQHGSCVIPKSGTPDHIKENAGIWDWNLAKDDFDKLSSIKFQVRQISGKGFLEKGPYKSVEELWDGEA